VTYRTWVTQAGDWLVRWRGADLFLVLCLLLDWCVWWGSKPAPWIGNARFPLKVLRTDCLYQVCI